MKNIRQRVASFALALFMLQVIAVGFCAPSAMASTLQPTVEHAQAMSGCMPSAMATESSEELVNCAHCDLPDLVLSLDKHQSSWADMLFAAVYVSTLTLLPSVDVSPTHFVAPPLRTSLLTHDLNQRFRV